MQAVKIHHMITPEHPNPIVASICAIVSLFSSVIAWISLHDAQVITAIVASVLAGISAIFGTVHFYYSIKEKRINIKKLNQAP